MNKILIPLDKVPVGSVCRVISILKSSKLKMRLLDLGIVPDSKIEILRENLGKTSVAYGVKGTVIALRNEDAEKVIVKLGD